MTKDSKFTNWSGENGFRIPAAALELAGIRQGEKLDFHVAEDVVVTLKHEMTALEMIHAIHALHELFIKLLAQIAAACGTCDICEEDEEDGAGCCPYDLTEQDQLTLPTDLRKAADIPADAKLQAVADPENHRVMISQAEHLADLSDVPDFIKELLDAQDIRLCILEQQLMEGGKIYG